MELFELPFLSEVSIYWSFLKIFAGQALGHNRPGPADDDLLLTLSIQYIQCEGKEYHNSSVPAS